MPRGFTVQPRHAVILALWALMVALDWPDLTTGAAHERAGTAAFLLVFLGILARGQLQPDRTDADEIRRVARIHLVVMGVVTGLVVAWALWVYAEGDLDAEVVVRAFLPAGVVAVLVWQYLRADRVADRAGAAGLVEPHRT